MALDSLFAGLGNLLHFQEKWTFKGLGPPRPTSLAASTTMANGKSHENGSRVATYKCILNFIF